MKNYIGLILIILNLFFMFLIMKIFNIRINVNSLFWVLLINCIAYIVEVYLLFGRKKKE